MVTSTSYSKSTASSGYYYAQYKISGAVVFSRNPGAVPTSVKWNLLWTSTFPNEQGTEFVNVTLATSNWTSSLRFNCTNGKLFLNRTYWGANVFNLTGLAANKPVDLGDSIQKQLGNVTGPYLLDTPYGTQNYWDVEIRPKVINKTFVSYYDFHVSTGLLLQVVSPSDWVFHLLGIDIIFGTMVLSSTNIDLGPSSPILAIASIYPFLVFFVIILTIALVYTHKRKRLRKERHRGLS